MNWSVSREATGMMKPCLKSRMQMKKFVVFILEKISLRRAGFL